MSNLVLLDDYIVNIWTRNLMSRTHVERSLWTVAVWTSVHDIYFDTSSQTRCFFSIFSFNPLSFSVAAVGCCQLRDASKSISSEQVNWISQPVRIGHQLPFGTVALRGWFRLTEIPNGYGSDEMEDSTETELTGNYPLSPDESTRIHTYRRGGGAAEESTKKKSRPGQAHALCLNNQC